jgi:hypothetical protein
MQGNREMLFLDGEGGGALQVEVSAANAVFLQGV